MAGHVWRAILALMAIELSPPKWLELFSAALQSLDRSVNAHEAAFHAVDVFGWADELEPELAAEIFYHTGGPGPNGCSTLE